MDVCTLNSESIKSSIIKMKRIALKSDSQNKWFFAFALEISVYASL